MLYLSGSKCQKDSAGICGWQEFSIMTFRACIRVLHCLPYACNVSICCDHLCEKPIFLFQSMSGIHKDAAGLASKDGQKVGRQEARGRYHSSACFTRLQGGREGWWRAFPLSPVPAMHLQTQENAFANIGTKLSLSEVGPSSPWVPYPKP